MKETRKPQWNPLQCQKALASHSWQEKRAVRQKVFQYTLDAINEKRYSVEVDGQKEDVCLSLADPVACSLFFNRTNRPEKIAFTTEYAMKVEVVNKDCIDAAKELLDATGAVPLVLNMASATHAGGGVEGGAGAQEENLCRRSDYVRFLYRYTPLVNGKYACWGLEQDKQHSYPLDFWDGAVYSKNVTVFRGNEAKGYPFLAEPFRLDFVAVAALNLRRKEAYEWERDAEGNYLLNEKEREVTCHKIRLMLRVAAQTGHRILVLSAFGCGAFSNPASEMAKLFAGVLKEDEFKCAFERIVFAILDDHNSHSTINPKGNYLPFKAMLG